LRPRLPAILLCCWLVILLAPWPSAQAAGARITDIIVTQASDQLVVFATLEEAFTPDIEESIVNGVPTTFTYQLRLMRQRAFLPDAEVSALTVRQSVAYDLLKDEFQFVRDDGRRNSTRLTKSYGEMKRWMAELTGVTLASRRLLQPEERYYVQVKAEIRSVSLVFPFNYLLFFVSFFNFDTPWAASSLFRVSR